MKRQVENPDCHRNLQNNENDTDTEDKALREMIEWVDKAVSELYPPGYEGYPAGK